MLYWVLVSSDTYTMEKGWLMRFFAATLGADKKAYEEAKEHMQALMKTEKYNVSLPSSRNVSMLTCPESQKMFLQPITVAIQQQTCTMLVTLLCSWRVTWVKIPLAR